MIHFSDSYKQQIRELHQGRKFPQILADLPSHFNWGIDTGTCKEFNSLNLQIKEYIEYSPKVMPIHARLFQSFLYMSKYKDPTPDYTRSKKYLKKAYEEIEFVSNEDEKHGYLTVAKCNEVCMDHMIGKQITNLPSEIEMLISTNTAVSQSYIDSVRAFALSRVGMPKYDEAKIFFQKALQVQPNNTQWLLLYALMIGRCSRIRDGFAHTTETAEERQLYNKILSIDDQNALAHVHLGVNYVRNGEIEAAINSAGKAADIEPQNPRVLREVGKILRYTGCYDAALKVLAIACSTAKNSALFLQKGLVYRDMCNAQNRKKREAIEKQKPYDNPDKGLLQKAVDCFTRALQANNTNVTARIQRASAYSRLQRNGEAEKDYEQALATTNLEFTDMVVFNVKFGFFFKQKHSNEERACEHFRIAIECAAKNCTISPVTRENPQPQFYPALKDLLKGAQENFHDVALRKTKSSDPELHSEGLKDLAWLHQVLGEHAAARDRYEEYLRCDKKSTDDKVICRLVKSLIQLGDFEETRKKIQELKNLNKTDLALSCEIECALLQGEDAMVQGNQVKLAKELFREAVEAGSMEGCQKLAHILQKDPDISLLEFRKDCAKILHCCKQNHQTDHSLYDDTLSLLHLEHVFYGKLRNKHLNLEQALLESTDSEVTLSKALEVMIEARFMLDRVMSEFQRMKYSLLPGRQVAYFTYIQQENTNKKRTLQELKDEMLRRLIKEYRLKQFDTRFPHLLDFLLKVMT